MKHVEYAVVWKRAECVAKRKKYRSRPLAERFMLLLGPEPWKRDADRMGRPKDPDSYMCCSGYECGCGGISLRQHYLEARKDLPPLEWMRLEIRDVEESPWRPAGLAGGRRG